MTQQQENLSAFLDGESNDGHESSSLINEMSADPQVLEKWKRYHLVRDCLRNENVSDISFDISASVAQALESELPMVAPKRTWKELPVVSSVVPMFKVSGQYAVAACVTAVMVFGFQSYNQSEEAQPFATAPPVAGPQGGLAPVSLEQTRTTGVDQRAILLEQRRQINALLEDHDRQIKLKNTGVAEVESAVENNNAIQENPQK